MVKVKGVPETICRLYERCLACLVEPDTEVLIPTDIEITSPSDLFVWDGIQLLNAKIQFMGREWTVIEQKNDWRFDFKRDVIEPEENNVP